MLVTPCIPLNEKETPIAVVGVIGGSKPRPSLHTHLSWEFGCDRKQSLVAEILNHEKILGNTLQRWPAMTGGCNRRFRNQAAIRILAPLLGNIIAQVAVDQPESVKPAFDLDGLPLEAARACLTCSPLWPGKGNNDGPVHHSSRLRSGRRSVSRCSVGPS